MNEWAKRKSIAPRRRQVDHFDEVSIRLELTLEPLQQDVTVTQHIYSKQNETGDI